MSTTRTHFFFQPGQRRLSAIASGTNHEMLGLGVFVLIFALALSTDRAINALIFEPIEESDFTDETTVEAVAIPKRVNDFKPAVIYSLIGLFVVMGMMMLQGQLSYFNNVIPPELAEWLAGQEERLIGLFSQ